MRKAFLYHLVGHNRTGKSTVALKIAERYKQSHPNNRIVSFDIQGRFRHISNEFITDEKDLEAYEKRRVKRTLFIFDDYHNLIDERVSKSLLLLLGQRNEWGLDFIFITHSPELIRKKVSYYITHYLLFYTAGSLSYFKKKTEDPERVIKCKKIIDNVWLSLSEEEQDKLYPDFPYILIEFASRKDRAVNFEKPISLIKNKNERKGVI